MRINKKVWRMLGGITNPKLWRKQFGKYWRYYMGG